jgi:hypothetical protein
MRKKAKMRSGTKKGCRLSPLLFDIVVVVLASTTKQEKEKNGMHTGKETLFSQSMINSHRKL